MQHSFARSARTKVVCTLGPATARAETIRSLLQAGMSVARLNFSHGTHAEHAQQAQWVREAAAQAGTHVALLQDLQGPKLRVGAMAPGAWLQEGASFVLTSEECVGDATRATCSYKPLPREVSPGQTILLDDGRLQLEVIRTTSTAVITRVVVGGPLSDHKGINVPGATLQVPAFSEKDQDDLRWGLACGVDAVALSFVRSAADVEQVRAFVKEHTPAVVGRPMPLLIAKIEKLEAIAHIDAILEVADGIMVARGDLGVELGPEKVPLLQKTLVEKANRRGKLVITATQMLESMTQQTRPTRAEASDVANAILDGTDAVMLSGETAQGLHPAHVVQTMVQLICEVEQSERFACLQRTQPRPQECSLDHALAHAAAVAAQQLAASAIHVVDETGPVAKLLSEYRPSVPIWVHTSQPGVANQLALYWGLTPTTLAVPSPSESANVCVYAEVQRHEPASYVIRFA